MKLFSFLFGIFNGLVLTLDDSRLLDDAHLDIGLGLCFCIAHFHFVIIGLGFDVAVSHRRLFWLCGILAEGSLKFRALERMSSYFRFAG